jgi:hypothetical protein
MSTPSMVTIADVALRLNVAHSTIRAYLARGQMPAATGYLGRTPWWAPEDIDPWLDVRVGPRFAPNPPERTP